MPTSIQNFVFITAFLPVEVQQRILAISLQSINLSHIDYIEKDFKSVWNDYLDVIVYVSEGPSVQITLSKSNNNSHPTTVTLFIKPDIAIRFLIPGTGLDSQFINSIMKLPNLRNIDLEITPAFTFYFFRDFNNFAEKIDSSRLFIKCINSYLFNSDFTQYQKITSLEVDGKSLNSFLRLRNKFTNVEVLAIEIDKVDHLFTAKETRQWISDNIKLEVILKTTDNERSYTWCFQFFRLGSDVNRNTTFRLETGMSILSPNVLRLLKECSDYSNCVIPSAHLELSDTLINRYFEFMKYSQDVRIKELYVTASNFDNSVCISGPFKRLFITYNEKAKLTLGNLPQLNHLIIDCVGKDFDDGLFNSIPKNTIKLMVFFHDNIINLRSKINVPKYVQQLKFRGHHLNKFDFSQSQHLSSLEISIESQHYLIETDEVWKLIPETVDALTIDCVTKSAVADLEALFIEDDAYYNPDYDYICQYKMKKNVKFSDYRLPSNLKLATASTSTSGRYYSYNYFGPRLGITVPNSVKHLEIKSKDSIQTPVGFITSNKNKGWINSIQSTNSNWFNIIVSPDRSKLTVSTAKLYFHDPILMVCDEESLSKVECELKISKKSFFKTFDGGLVGYYTKSGKKTIRCQKSKGYSPNKCMIS